MGQTPQWTQNASSIDYVTAHLVRGSSVGSDCAPAPSPLAACFPAPACLCRRLCCLPMPVCGRHHEVFAAGFYCSSVDTAVLTADISRSCALPPCFLCLSSVGSELGLVGPLQLRSRLQRHAGAAAAASTAITDAWASLSHLRRLSLLIDRSTALVLPPTFGAPQKSKSRQLGHQLRRLPFSAPPLNPRTWPSSTSAGPLRSPPA